MSNGGPRLARVLLVTIASTTMLVGARSASAADARAEAAEFFRAATAAYERREFRAAALAFEEAYRRAPRGAVAYNAALAWQGLGDEPRAADDYALAIEDQALDAPSRDDAQERLARLEKTLAQLRVTDPVDLEVSVAHVERATIPRTIHLVPGSYVVELFAKGRAVAKRRVAASLGRQTIAFDKPPEPTPMLRADPTFRILGWTSLGIGAALAGTAVVLGIEATRTRDSFDASGDTDATLRTRAITLRTLTNVAWGSAAAFGLTGVALIAFAPERVVTSGRAPSQRVWLTLGDTSVVAHGTF